MHKKHLSIVIIIILLIGQVIIVVPAYSEETGQNTESIETLMATVSIETPALEAEAERLGIPESEKKRYVVTMRELNEEYLQGSMTRTEYITAKRNVLEELR